MTDTTKAEIPADASDDDLKAMGLPPSFTLDDLRKTFEPEEIEWMAEDGLIELPDDFVRSRPAKNAADTIRNRESNDQHAETDKEGDENTSQASDADEEAEADTEPDTEAEAEAEPVLDLKDSSAAQKVLDSYDDDLSAINDLYEEGELTSAEMRGKIKDLNTAHLKAQREVEAAERHNADQQAAYQDAWYGKTAAYMEAHPEFSAQTPIAKLGGHSALQVFDQSLKFVNGDDRYAGMAMGDRIAEAAKIANAYVKQQTGSALTAPVQTREPGQQTKAAAKGGPRTDPRPEPPQTLANVSAATEESIVDGKFAAIDRAGIMEAESMIARLTPAEREAYLRGD